MGACGRRAPSGLGNACEWANRSNPNKLGTRRDRTSRTRTASRGIVSVRATPEHTAAKLAYTAKALLESVEIDLAPLLEEAKEVEMDVDVAGAGEPIMQRAPASLFL